MSNSCRSIRARDFSKNSTSVRNHHALSKRRALTSNRSSILEKTKPRFNSGAACSVQVRLIG
jgi:hypothetical protein